MSVIGDATIEVHADTDGFGKSVNSRFSSIAKTAAGIFASAFAAQKAFDFVGDSLAEAREAAQVARLTEAVVKSTGGAANVSVGHLSDLAERLSNIAAVDDEVIQSAGNVLLTFTKVRNEVGKGNDIFDRATTAALDMSAALKTDLQGATLQLGKALNDPIKGITALSRAGVSFTQQQKDQIKTLVDSGKTLEAQKIILDELAGEFGGAAAAAADPTARLGVVVGNLKERIGLALLPVVEKTATWLSNQLPAALDTAAQFFHKARDAIAPIVAALRDQLGPVLADVAQWVGGTLMPALAQLGGWLADHQPVLVGFGIAVAALAAPFTTLAAGVFLAYQRFEGFRSVVDAVGRFLRDTVGPAVAAFATTVTEQFGRAVSWVQRYWPQISEAVGHVMRVVREVVGVAIDVVSAAWRAFGDDLLRIVETVWGYITRTIQNALGVVQGVIRTVVALINGDWGKAWDGIKQVLSSVWDQIKNIVGTAIGVVKSVLGGAVSVIQEVWRGGWEKVRDLLGGIWNGIADAVSRGKDRVLDIVRGLPGTIMDAFGGAATWLYDIGKDIIGGLWDGIYDATIGTLKDGLSWVGDRIPDWKGPLSKDRKLLVPTGKAIIQGLLDGIRSSTGDVQAYLQAFTQNILSTVQTAFSAINANRSLHAAQVSLREARRSEQRLEQRQRDLPGIIAELQQNFDRARADAAKVTPAEQLAIDRAQKAVNDKAAEFIALQESGTASALDLRIAENEVRVAQEELASAIRDSTGVTDEMNDAWRELNEAMEEQRGMASALAEAHDAVADAQLGVVEATASLSAASSELSNNPSLLAWLQDIARQAGLTEDAILELLGALTDATGITPPTGTGTTPGGQRGGNTAPGLAPKVATRQDIENIARFVGEQWSPGKVDRILQQINDDHTRTLESVVADVDRRINGPDNAKAIVNFQSIDPRTLTEKLQIKAAVGEALSTATRLRPVVKS